METISFVYNGNTYTGTLKLSVRKEPYYYWIYLNDVELTTAVGKSILIISKNGRFNTPHYYPAAYKNLITIIKEAVKNYVAESTIALRA